jgi:pimeloyl-ACP methyl ester carboxylesterase
MERHSLQHDGLTLSYLDQGGRGKPLVALHGHWFEGATYSRLATALAPQWRLVAPDQRGHGHSDRATSYTRDDYIGDIAAMLDHLSVADVVLLGNSLGGVNAYQYAARYPQDVRGLIIEDIGVEIADDMHFVASWKGNFANRAELERRIGPRLLPYLRDAFRCDAAGWHLAFDPADMMKSQRALNGTYWRDWLASDCPALLIHGRDSHLTRREQFEEMATRRPRTQLMTLDGGHVVHVDNPRGFAKAVHLFLDSL